jgi:hypothetical protein
MPLANLINLSFLSFPLACISSTPRTHAHINLWHKSDLLFCISLSVYFFSLWCTQLVTATGCYNMTKCPREIHEIEAVMAGAPWPVKKTSTGVGNGLESKAWLATACITDMNSCHFHISFPSKFCEKIIPLVPYTYTFSTFPL